MADDSASIAAGGQIATTVLVIEAAASLYAAFCPSWFTTRSAFFHEQRGAAGNVQAIRQGYIAATLLAVPTGFASSYLVKSWLPLIGSVAIGVLMIGGYEYSIRHPATEVPPDPPGWMDAMQWGAAKS